MLSGYHLRVWARLVGYHPLLMFPQRRPLPRRRRETAGIQHPQTPRRELPQHLGDIAATPRYRHQHPYHFSGVASSPTVEIITGVSGDKRFVQRLYGPGTLHLPSRCQ